MSELIGKLHWNAQYFSSILNRVELLIGASIKTARVAFSDARIARTKNVLDIFHFHASPRPIIYMLLLENFTNQIQLLEYNLGLPTDLIL